MARRRFQRGSLKLDVGKPGQQPRWIARWREDVLDPATGKIRRVKRKQILSKKAFPTKPLAQAELARILVPINSGEAATVDMTFADLAGRWKATEMKKHKDSTQKTETAYIQTLLATFGKFPMQSITAEAIDTWVSTLEQAPKTVRNLIFTFKSLWKTAKRWGCVHHDPFAGMRLPTWEKGNVHHFTMEQQLAIIEAAITPWHKVFFRVLAETGMRGGEAAGLRPQDIGDHSITVKQSVWAGEIQPTPKTKGSAGTFPVSEALVRMIRDHIEESGPNDHGLVFVNRYGSPIDVDNFRMNVLKPLLKKLGINPSLPCGLHGFRHGNATLMDVMRVPIKIRQQRLRHKDAETTLNHYTEPVSAEARIVAEQIGAMFERKGSVQ